MMRVIPASCSFGNCRQIPRQRRGGIPESHEGAENPIPAPTKNFSMCQLSPLTWLEVGSSAKGGSAYGGQMGG